MSFPPDFGKFDDSAIERLFEKDIFRKNKLEREAYSALLFNLFNQKLDSPFIIHTDAIKNIALDLKSPKIDLFIEKKPTGILQKIWSVICNFFSFIGSSFCQGKYLSYDNPVQSPDLREKNKEEILNPDQDAVL